MAALDAANRKQILAQIVRNLPWPGLTKPNVQAAIDAVDDWAEANAAAYNTALPNPFKTTASASQKALILAYVCMRRAGILKVEGE